MKVSASLRRAGSGDEPSAPNDGNANRTTRRSFVRRVGGTGLGALLGASAVSGRVDATSGERESGPPFSGSDGTYFERATVAYEALQEYFYREDVPLYLERYPRQEGDTPYSYAWPFSQAMAATVDLFALTGGGDDSRYRDDVQARLDGLTRYWNPNEDPKGYDSYVRPPLGDGGEIYYDDNEWIGLELINLYRMTGDEHALTRARQVFDLVVYGWDDDPSHPKPGGVFWTQGSNQDRNTVSNAPGALLGLRLYRLSDDPEERAYYLDWSTRMYEWVDQHLRAPNGLYWDHVNIDGTVTKWIFTYNQGTMIGVNVLLYEISGEEQHLEEAERIADRALAYFGQDDRLYEEDMAFTAIFFRNLRRLQAANGDARLSRVVREYADEIWKRDLNPETNLVRRNGDGTTSLLQQAALVQINALLPMLLDPPRTDVDGDGETDYADVVDLFERFNSTAVRDDVGSYDFNGNGRLDFDDIVELIKLI